MSCGAVYPFVVPCYRVEESERKNLCSRVAISHVLSHRCSQHSLVVGMLHVEEHLQSSSQHLKRRMR